MGQELTLYDKFSHEIAAREEELSNVLAPHIPPERFKQVALIAVKNNPDLLKVNRKSLHQAITEAAEDGLMPDGREGVITPYKGEASWNPMVYGIRKRAKELCNMIIDSQVVHQNDRFVWHQGDEPRIEHVPAPLGTDRGPAVGVYAIFKVDGVIMHREVMDAKQVEAVQSMSNAKSSLMWTKFKSEGWRKTVIRRGAKTVPAVAALERLIARVDKDFDFGPKTVTIDEVPTAPKQSKAIEQEVIDVVSDEIADMDAPLQEAVSAPPPAKKKEAPKKASQPKGDEDVLGAFRAGIKAAETVSALNGIWDIYESKLKGKDRDTASEEFEHRYEELA